MATFLHLAPKAPLIKSAREWRDSGIKGENIRCLLLRRGPVELRRNYLPAHLCPELAVIQDELYVKAATALDDVGFAPREPRRKIT